MRNQFMILSFFFCSAASAQDDTAKTKAKETSSSESQTEAAQGIRNSVVDFERILYFRIEQMATFYEVDQRSRILRDTVFYSKPGFLIHPYWYEFSLGGETFVALTYLNYNKGRQYYRDSIALSHGLTANQETFALRFPIRGINGKSLAMTKSEFESLKKSTAYSTSWRKYKNFRVTTGVMTLPLKIRPKMGSTNFQMTTDVSVGPYVGVTKRLFRYDRTYLTVPFSLGLAFVNVNDNKTSSTGAADAKSGITPGLTWATGITLQWVDQQATVGIMLGKDYASGYGSEWKYHDKLWYSIGIGYSFLRKK